MGQSQAKTCKIRLALAFMAAAMLALAWSPAALAQQDDQYGGTVPPSGPAALAECLVEASTNDVVDAGDLLSCFGDFNIAEGASVILQDADGTQGTFIDGQNANITEGSIVLDVTGDPAAVAGGDGVLNTEGLFVVATTGISAAADDGAADDGAGSGAGETGADDGAAVDDGAAADDSATVDDGAETEDAPVGVSVLPDTGGSAMLFVLFGGLTLVGAGFVIRRFSASN